MKIKFMATGIAPDRYEFDGEKITFDNETFDLSAFEEGDIFQGIEHEMQVIRAVERIEGELYITLCQKSPVGHWTGDGIGYIDATEYDPEKSYIRERTPEEMAEVEQWGR